MLVRRAAGDGPWLAIEKRLISGEISLREALQLEAATVRLSLDEAAEILAQTTRVDPSFAPFVRACTEREVPLAILSSGIAPIIARALARYGLVDVPLLANDVDVSDRGWRIRFRDDSPNGHDKAAAVRAAQAAGATAVFIGDGRSDFDAASLADRRFAKRGRALERFLRQEQLEHHPFSTFAEVEAALFG